MRPTTVTHATPVEVAADRVDLPEWWFTMPDAAYRAASPAHLAFGTSTAADGKRLAVCLERLGGAMMLHHYQAEVAEADHLRITSPESRGWLGGMLPIRFSATADIRIRPVAQEGSELVFGVEGTAPTALLRAMFASPVMRAILHKHLEEEMAVFARDIAQRYAQRSPVRR